MTLREKASETATEERSAAMTNRLEKKPKLSVEDKYRFYEDSVQAFESDVDFMKDEFKRIHKRKPATLREDFGGTAAMACHWVKQSPQNKAVAVDLDPEPVEYGKRHHYGKLTPAQKKRMKYVMADVMNADRHKADIVAAFNFSYFIFKERKEMLKYFKSVHRSLKKPGLFFLDIVGGPEMQTVLEERTKFKKFTYFWDCQRFNPIRNEGLWAIHFKPKGKKKIKNVFTYDWRLWSPAELRDILADAGFKETVFYWEGDDPDGGGNGEFYPSEEEENCDSWIGYIVAIP